MLNGSPANRLRIGGVADTHRSEGSSKRYVTGLEVPTHSQLAREHRTHGVNQRMVTFKLIAVYFLTGKKGYRFPVRLRMQSVNQRIEKLPWYTLGRHADYVWVGVIRGFVTYRDHYPVFLLANCSSQRGPVEDAQRQDRRWFIW